MSGGELVQATGGHNKQITTHTSSSSSSSIIPSVQRTSSLNAPIMLLTGHKAEVNSVRFSPNGEFIATAGGDKEIFFWNTYGDCLNYLVLPGHQGSILEVSWSGDGTKIASASADKTVAFWDVEHGERIKKCKEHNSFVNSCDVSKRGSPMIVSGSDDTSCRVWDPRVKASVHVLSHRFPVTAVAFSDAGELVFTGGIDNQIRVWDLRRGDIIYTLFGHEDTITGLRLSPDGSYILSNSMDNTARIFDIRPYAPAERQLKVFTGIQHTFEKNLLRCAWSHNGERVAAGSGDRFVYIWDTSSRRLLYKLPGHAGSVNDLDFHPKEPIIASASSDRTVYLGETVL
eukprot:TRINITY_DN5605_c0_g1_i1.p1 TRINITY_DN5605_c0_g1~~TRINITY_DN5605_c0_g1_i1.p1  ORF type:complete len:343 (-),score=65.81 TRINITY_DN5605_c0_g1_i1:14-1042(-)